jgi:hypothetical protein
MKQFTEQEAKLRYFAMYLGADLDNKLRLLAVNIDTFNRDYWYAVLNGNMVHKAPNTNDKLLLTDLKDISDEDAIEVAKLVRIDGTLLDEFKAREGRILVQDYMRKVSNVLAVEWINAINYLRYKGYFIEDTFLNFPTKDWVIIKNKDNGKGI